MQTVTLAEAQSDFELLGDLQGLVAVGGRHTPLEVRRQLCASERSLRSLLASKGYGFRVESTAPANLPVAASPTTETYVTVPWPTAAPGAVLADEIVTVHAFIGGSWCELDQVDWMQRRAYAQVRGALFWCIKALPDTDRTGTTALTAGQIAIMPVPTGGQYSIDFLPEFPELAADADKFTGMPDWHRWRVLDALVQFLDLRDGDDQGRAPAIVRELARVQARMLARAPGRSGPKAQPVRRPRGT